jgi:4-amino-4-deoxy-L-arabinose transferase-like glycosyltransferase
VLFPALATAVAVLYLFHLDAAGVLSTDEPRYMAIGRAMAASGDWITPRLWGAPWFEKPPFLYWLVAVGTNIGLPMDLTGRLPIALLSLTFLALYFFVLRREFCFRAAAIATLLLACSAGWLAYSSLSLTDLPLAVFFTIAVLAVLPLVAEPGPSRHVEVLLRLVVAGTALGLAVLAKGLVPIALGIPAAWYLRRYWRDWWLAIATCLLAAGPWYWLVYERNGFPFIQEFFLKHHLARLYSATIEHIQPWYFYVPVLLAAVFPWTPLLALPVERRSWTEPRRQFLLVTIVFGLIFFSISLNKLPGYLLPLLPCLFVLIGAWFEDRHLADLKRGWMIACAACIAMVPFLASMIPLLLARQQGIGAVVSIGDKTRIAFALLPVGFALLARRRWLGPILIFSCVAVSLYLKEVTYPMLDQVVSPRGLWRELQPNINEVCDAGLHRAWQYGLAFYNGRPLPLCTTGDFKWELKQQGNERPLITPHASATSSP